MFSKLLSSHKEKLANLPNISSDLKSTEMRKFDDEIKSHVRCSDSLNVRSDSYSSLLVPMIMRKLPPQQKLVVCRYLRPELWG